MSARMRTFGRFSGVVLTFAAGVLGIALLYGGAKPASAEPQKKQKVKLAKAGVAAYFSPNGGAENALMEAIDSAQQELLVGVYLFTSRKLTNAVKRAHGRNVQTRVLIDHSGARIRFSGDKELTRVGIPVRVMRLGKTDDKQPIKYHQKYAVIDRRVVVTGSHNWTKQADTHNHENIVIVVSKEIAESYRQQFEAAWELGEEKDEDD
ncbi:phospholipase D-like domain-containing protein [Planctomycetota bacterium]